MQIEQTTLFPDPPRPWGAISRRRARPARPSPDGRGRHASSIEAHATAAERITERARLVLARVRRAGPMTDREIRNALFGPEADMNMVRPRVSELLDAGLLVEHGRALDPTTGMRVRRVAAARGA